MSLEDDLKQNTAALKENTEALLKLLGQTNGAKATTSKAADKAADAPADKPADKAADAPADKPAEKAADSLTFDEVKSKAAAWLGEHPKGSDEQAARRAYLETQLWPKLGIKKLGDLADKPAEYTKVNNWLDNKSKTDLFGYGAGIFAKPADADTGDEEEL